MMSYCYCYCYYVLDKIEYPFIPEYKSQQLNYRIFLNTLDFNEQNE